MPGLRHIRSLIVTMLLLLSALSIRLYAQEQFITPPARLLTNFSFKMLTGGIVIVSATLDNCKDSLNFIFDTGSGGISLDSATVDYLKLERTATSRTIKGIAGVRKVDFAFNHSLHLPGLTVDSLDFHINDYELLTSVYGVKIDGIMGYSFLKRYIVCLNYDKHEMGVYSQGSFTYPRNSQFLRPVFSSIPIQQVTVKDTRAILARYYLDTGAGLCMLFSQSFVDDSSLLLKKRKIFDTQAEGLGGKKSMRLTVIKEVKVGPYRLKKVPVYLFDDDYNVTAYPTLGGLLGNDIMRRFNVVFNYADQLICIKPNTHYREEFDYSYTGLGIYVVDRHIKVIDVIKGSPGEKAGFMTDDVILSIDNNFSNDIQAYKAMFQHPRTTLRIIVLRKGSPVTLKLRIKSILD
ncbi:hypothetical protein GCM10011379_56080 [Filimonas zeae]|uniref:PDZ domain-containing protein n=2 Tax=Filimonas zeae TaxID=1737353 RepID=A0A917J5L6_9BACT|nr:hypothetical protein GCM10011379_56080 [Filimonas zeae]